MGGWEYSCEKRVQALLHGVVAPSGWWSGDRGRELKWCISGRQILESWGISNKKDTERNCTRLRTLQYIWQEEIGVGNRDLRSRRVRKVHLCEVNGWRCHDRSSCQPGKWHWNTSKAKQVWDLLSWPLAHGYLSKLGGSRGRCQGLKDEWEDYKMVLLSVFATFAHYGKIANRKIWKKKNWFWCTVLESLSPLGWDVTAVRAVRLGCMSQKYRQEAVYPESRAR